MDSADSPLGVVPSDGLCRQQCSLRLRVQPQPSPASAHTQAAEESPGWAWEMYSPVFISSQRVSEAQRAAQRGALRRQPGISASECQPHMLPPCAPSSSCCQPGSTLSSQDDFQVPHEPSHHSCLLGGLWWPTGMPFRVRDCDPYFSTPTPLCFPHW